jgi:hypothetical protein
VRKVIAGMEAEDFRPRIQDGYRTPADQLKAFNSGNSLVKFGFHNVTGKGGKPESLAVDLIDDDNPLASGRCYIIRLAAFAEQHGLNSGIFFFTKKTPSDGKEALRAAIEGCPPRRPGGPTPRLADNRSALAALFSGRPRR